MSEPSAELLQRYRDGDEAAAEEMFQRYVARLTQLARSRLSPRLARRVDAEDVVLSAYRSFFVGSRRGRFDFAEAATCGGCWRRSPSAKCIASTNDTSRRNAASIATNRQAAMASVSTDIRIRTKRPR